MSKKKIVAFFDIDNTLVHGSSSVYFLHELMNLGYLKKRDLIYQLYHGIRFKLFGEDIDFLDKLKKHGLPIKRSIKVSWLREEMLDVYEKRLEPKIRKSTLKKLKNHQMQDNDIWLLSAAPQIIVDILVKKLELTGGFGTQVEIINDELTGKIRGELMHSRKKATTAKLIAKKYGYTLKDSYAYGDSVNDIPLLTTVGNPTVVNPDRKLKRYANSVQWPILL